MKAKKGIRNINLSSRGQFVASYYENRSIIRIVRGLPYYTNCCLEVVLDNGNIIENARLSNFLIEEDEVYYIG